MTTKMIKIKLISKEMEKIISRYIEGMLKIKGTLMHDIYLYKEKPLTEIRQSLLHKCDT